MLKQLKLSNAFCIQPLDKEQINLNYRVGKFKTIVAKKIWR